MATFGNRPEDSVTDSKGNVRPGVVITVFATEADAISNRNSIGSKSAGSDGRWPIDLPGKTVVWAREPNGSVWSVASDTALSDHETRLDTVETELPNKLEAADISGKADVTYVDTGLAGKAPATGSTEYETKTVVAGKVGKGEQLISVMDYGATGAGTTTDDTTAINAAVTAARAGDTILFPSAASFYKITAPITGKTGVKFVGSRGVEIRQATQYKPVFDLFNASSVTVDGFTLTNASGPPPGTGANIRGDAGYAFSCAVWANTGGNTITNLRVIDFGMPINLNSSDGTTNVGDHAKRIGNTVRNMEASGLNHGVVLLNQDQAVVDNVYCHDHVDSSAGGNPMHAVYVTGTTADTSTNLTVTNCRDANNATGHAFQFKYTNGLNFSNLSASSCFGILNMVDVFDVVGSNLLSVGDVSTGGALVLQKGTNQPARINISNVTITKAVDSTIELGLGCDDAKFSNVSLTTLKNGLNVAAQDIQLRGSRITCDGFKVRNVGSSSARCFLIGGSGYTVADCTISNFEIDGYRMLVDIYPTATGINCVSWSPSKQRNISFGTGSYVGALSGTPPFIIERSPCTRTYPVAAAGTYYPLPGLETVSRFEATTANNFTLREPLIGTPPAGTIHEIAVKNAGTGAMGTITWNALYAWKSSAPASPAAGVTLNLRFMWDGAAWREM